VAFVAIKGDRIMLAQREAHSDEPEWDAGWLFFGYNCCNFGLDFLATPTLMEPRPMPEDRNTMVANNFEASPPLAEVAKPHPGQP
jgi:hypothetical protein